MSTLKNNKTEEIKMAEIINDKDLGQVSGGWQYANGSFVNYGNYIVYTVAPGDVLSGIGQRFGVSYMQIAQWNNIKNPDKILIGQKLTIYPAVIR
jgi:nucleoid-associated protein YgaU